MQNTGQGNLLRVFLLLSVNVSVIFLIRSDFQPNVANFI